MTPTIEITPDTTLYTLAADFAGYTLEDMILGNISSEHYASSCTGMSEEQACEGICELMASSVKDGGVWLSEDEAKESLDDGERHTGRLISFTPRSAHRRVMEQAAKDADYNS